MERKQKLQGDEPEKRGVGDYGRDMVAAFKFQVVLGCRNGGPLLFVGPVFCAGPGG